jgi:RNA polymerase sigma factor (sigma-70 family)
VRDGCITRQELLAVASADDAKLSGNSLDRSVSPAGETRLDSALVAALYVEHSQELQRFLLGILRDSQLASDVLQATFVKLVERGHETKPETRKAWLFRVAYHEAMAYRRRQGVGDKVLRRVAWQAPACQTTAADVPLLQFESVQAVRQALDELPAEQRQIVRMRIYEEKTFAVIADELQIPLGTALGRMRAATIKLRATLDKTTNSEESES